MSGDDTEKWWKRWATPPSGPPSTQMGTRDGGSYTLASMCRTHSEYKTTTQSTQDIDALTEHSKPRARPKSWDAGPPPADTVPRKLRPVRAYKSRSPKEISALFDFIMARPDLAVDAPQGLAQLRRPHQDVRLRLADAPRDALLLHGRKYVRHANRLRRHIHTHPRRRGAHTHQTTTRHTHIHAGCPVSGRGARTLTNAHHPLPNSYHPQPASPHSPP